jgi:hypothetical protein
VLDDLAQSFRLIALAPVAVPLSASEQLDEHSFAREALACANRLGLKRFSVLARDDEDHAALCLGLLAGERMTALALIAPDLHSRDGSAQGAQLMEQLGQVHTPALALFGALDRIATPHTGAHCESTCPRAISCSCATRARRSIASVHMRWRAQQTPFCARRPPLRWWEMMRVATRTGWKAPEHERSFGRRARARSHQRARRPLLLLSTRAHGRRRHQG